MLIRSFVLFALGTAWARPCQANLRFQVNGHFLSKNFTQKVQDASYPVPMVWDRATEQLVRILSSNTLNPSENTLEKVDLDDEIDYKQENLLTSYSVSQAFNAELDLRRQKALGPIQCPARTLDVFYTSVASSSASFSVSVEDYPSYLSYGCPFQATVLNSPSLSVRCSVVNDTTNLLKIATSSEGITYLLYAGRLVSVDANCYPLNSANFIRKSQTFIAVDMIVDEATNTIVVGFKGLHFAQYSMSSLGLKYMGLAYNHVGEREGDYQIVPSALASIIGFIYARVYFNNLVYILIIRPRDEPLLVPLPVGRCSTNVAFPVLIPDYLHNQDFIISRATSPENSLLIVVNKLLSVTMATYDCYTVELPPGVNGEVIAFSGAKKPSSNSFFISFTPSLDVVNVTFELGP